MKPILPFCLAGGLLLLCACQELALESVARDFGLVGTQGVLDDATIARGLKEALAVGTSRAVQTVSGRTAISGTR